MHRSLAVLIAISFAISACRLRIPTPAENEALLQRGTFVGEVPSWASQGAALGGRRSGISMGFMPTSFASTTGSTNTQAGSAAFDKTIVEKKAENYEKRKKEEATTRESAPQVTKDDNKATGPLGRVAAICPELEKMTTDALTTVDRKLKARKFGELAQRCQRSPDLWYWLGAEYFALGRLADAENALNSALSYLGLPGSPDIPEVRTLLNKVKAKQQEMTQNKTSLKKKATSNE